MGFVRRHLLDPLRAQLTQGVSPTRLALALALGATLGVVPLLGVTTLLCAALAAALKLNQPAIQVTNYLAYPVQLLLFVPLLQAGAWLFGQPPVPLTLEQFQVDLAADALGTLGRSLVHVGRGIVVWALVAPPAAGLLFVGFRAILSRLPRPVAAAEPP